MADNKISARARVQVVVTLDLGAAWGADCTVGQVHQQAGREAEQHIRQVLLQDARVLAIETVHVTAVFALEDRRG